MAQARLTKEERKLAGRLRLRRLLGWVVFAGAVVCAGGGAAAWGQAAAKLKREPRSLDETMVWLRSSIGQTGGFALGGDKLRYEFAGQDVCRLSWRASAAGDADLLELYPGVEQVEELKEIVPESVRVLPVDVKDLLAGGTGAASGGEAGVYWKITASYVDGRKLPEEPFGFVFADRETAQRVAAVLGRGVGLCDGAKAPREKENDMGCDASPTLKVVYEGAPSKETGLDVKNGGTRIPFEYDSELRELKITNGHMVNRNHEAVSCVFGLSYYAPVTRQWVRDAYVSFELGPGEGLVALEVPQYVDAAPLSYYHQCFAPRAVNVLGHACADLNHATHPALMKEKVGAAHE